MMHSQENPFLDDVHVSEVSLRGRIASGRVDSVNELHAGSLAVLGEHLADLGASRTVMVLLRSPRAGMGKSHLLSRLVSARDDVYFVGMDVNRDSHPSWVRWLRGILKDCSESPGGGQPAFLEQVSRRLMAEATIELILRGDVPAANPAAAIAMLKRDYVKIFDMAGGGSEVARWLVANFNELLPLMGEVLGSRAVIDPDEAVAWLRVLSRFNAGNVAERKAILGSVAMFGEDDAAQEGAKQRLRSFCKLASIERPLVLVIDHIDSLAGDGEEPMVLACMISEFLRQQFGGGVILSVNRDVWAASLGDQLPNAIEDRLTSRVVDLQGINVSEAEALVRWRLANADLEREEVEKVIVEARLREVVATRWGGFAAPREVLRHAAAIWDQLVGEPGGGGAAVEQSVADYLPGVEQLPGASSLAEPETLRPVTESFRSETRASGKAPEPGKVDPGTIKQMGNISSLLRELKSRREQFVPGAREAGGLVPVAPIVEETAPDEGASPVVRRFRQVRDGLIKVRDQRLDQDALRRLVSLAGESFPVVESSEFKMSPGEEPMVMKWAFPGNEILFGFEPEHQFRYWQSLIKLAARRAESGAAGRLKLVVFCPRDQPFSGAASADEAELERARAKYLDVIDLDLAMVASVIAADRVVVELAKAETPVLPAEAIRELAPQLDPLWRRITRPLEERDTGGERD